jgi:hypothetical protein
MERDWPITCGHEVALCLSLPSQQEAVAMGLPPTTVHGDVTWRWPSAVFLHLSVWNLSEDEGGFVAYGGGRHTCIGHVNESRRTGDRQRYLIWQQTQQCRRCVIPVSRSLGLQASSFVTALFALEQGKLPDLLGRGA